MKNILQPFLLLVMTIGIIHLFPNCTSNEDARTIKNFNADWLFSLDEDFHWKKVSLPHTPRIEPLIVNDQWQGNMWYKKLFMVSDRNKRYVLHFEAIMHESKVFLNDELLGNHQGGYLPFSLDITEHILYGDTNELMIKVNNEDNPAIPPGKNLDVLDFNYYGGIYRSVRLIETNKTYITDPLLENRPASGGVLVHFDEVRKEYASGKIKVHVRSEKEIGQHVHFEALLISPDGERLSYLSNEKELKPRSDAEFTADMQLDNPALWSTAKPFLYTLEIKLFENGDCIDTFRDKIGIRKIDLRNDGFYLNDEKMYLRGTNRHQEYPYVGYALSKNANFRDAYKIKQAGFDFVRLSHYPQDESFLEACDELGILVMDAIPGWQFIGDSVFLRNSYQNIRDMVRRDRNHPSVVFWEVSLNESAMSGDYMVEANRILKEEMPFSDTYSAGWIDHEAYDLFIPARQHALPPDYWNTYKNKEKPVFIAEYGDWEYYAQNAGFNQTGYEDLREEERSSRQLRSAGEKRLLQQAMNFQEAANSNRKGMNTIGDANWLMFDYNRGYANDIESSGIADIFRIPKFAYYFYQSQRPPADTLAIREGTGPMVKIATFWTPGSEKDIIVFSNCEEVALYLNDSLINRSKAAINEFNDQLGFPPFSFHVDQFEPGELKALGFIGNHNVAQDVVLTPESPAKLFLEIDTSGMPLSPAESDLVFIYAKITDQNGTLVPDAENVVLFTCSAGKLIGENPIKAEAGIASILLKTSGEEPGIVMRASSEGLESAGVIGK